MFCHAYRMALRGDQEFSRRLVKLALIYLKDGDLPPPGLRRYFLRIVESPKEYAALMKSPSRTTRGRPSADSHMLPQLGKKRFLGQEKTEQNALMVAYLHSLGHPINELGNDNYESAVVLVSAITGRSIRSLQRDYYMHKSKISINSLTRGKELYDHRRLNPNKRP